MHELLPLPAFSGLGEVQQDFHNVAISTFPASSLPSPSPYIELLTTSQMRQVTRDLLPLLMLFLQPGMPFSLTHPAKGLLVFSPDSPGTPAVAFPDHLPTPPNATPSLSCHHLLAEGRMYLQYLQQSCHTAGVH